MKKVLVISLLLVFSASPPVVGAETGVQSMQTGDAQLDRDLGELNERAKTNIRDFTVALGRHYGVAEETTDWLLNKVCMSPADAYMTARVAGMANLPIPRVVDEYEKNKGKGWGVIAKNLGIKPGSREFHELKKDDYGMLGESKGKKLKKAAGKKGKKE